MRKTLIWALLSASSAAGVSAQSDSGGVWNTLSAPAMDAKKAATVENVQIVRDRAKITLVNGPSSLRNLQMEWSLAPFSRGRTPSGRAAQSHEAQQLRLFTKQDKLHMTFSEATFSFTDGSWMKSATSEMERWRGHG